MSPKTESEGKFEYYLEGLGLRWERIATSETKQPDYSLDYGGARYLFEVKEFDHPRPLPSGGFSPCPPIRQKISAAARQFKAHKADCCAVVLWNSKSIYRSVQTEVVLSAAFGKTVRRTPNYGDDLGAGPARWRLSGSAALTKEHNTTISAVVILSSYRLNHLWLEAWKVLDAKKQAGHEIQPEDQFNILHDLSSDLPATYSYEGTIRSIVVENPYARIQFPTSLLSGPFDQRWQMQDGWFKMTFMGPELMRLKQDGVPFIYL